MRWQKMKIAMIATACFMFLILNGCAGMNTPKVPVGYVELPFAAHQAGAVVEADIEIEEDRPYTFALLLWFKNMSDIDYIERFANTGHGGIGIRLALEVVGLDEPNKTFLYSKNISARESTGAGFPKQNRYGAGGYHNRLITYIRLKPGLYKVKIRSLDNVPELAEMPVSFEISYNRKIQKY